MRESSAQQLEKKMQRPKPRRWYAVSPSLQPSLPPTLLPALMGSPLAVSVVHTWDALLVRSRRGFLLLVNLSSLCWRFSERLCHRVELYKLQLAFREESFCLRTKYQQKCSSNHCDRTSHCVPGLPRHSTRTGCNCVKIIFGLVDLIFGDETPCQLHHDAVQARK